MTGSAVFVLAAVLLVLINQSASTASKSAYTPVPLQLPATEEQQHASFWSRVKTLIAQEISQVPFLQILDTSWSNFHRNLDERVTKRLAAEEQKIKDIADPTKRKYVYVPENAFEKLLDQISTNDPDVLNVVGTKPLVGLVPDASPQQRQENRRKVMWSWVERTSKFVESEINRPSYERRLALPTNVRQEQFQFLMLDPRGRTEAARTGQLKPEMTRSFSPKQNLAAGITYETLISETNINSNQDSDDHDNDDDDETVEQEVPYFTFPWKFESEMPTQPNRKPT